MKEQRNQKFRRVHFVVFGFLLLATSILISAQTRGVVSGTFAVPTRTISPGPYTMNAYVRSYLGKCLTYGSAISVVNGTPTMANGGGTTEPVRGLPSEGIDRKSVV